MAFRTTLRGPKGDFLFGNLHDFAQDPLRFLEGCVRDYGDFVTLRFFNRTVCLLNHEDDIAEVLVTQSRNFRKTLGYRTPFMRRLFGQGLLTSEGDLWLRQRRLAQPAFHRDRIAAYAQIIVEYARRLLQSWESGQRRDVHNDMLRLTTEVVSRTLFNSEVSQEIDDLGAASAVVMKRFTSQWSRFRLISSFLPSPASFRFNRVVRSLDAFIYGLIRQRRVSGEDTGDLLSMLLLAQDEDGSRMTDRQLRDELTTLMLAGLDTTALALSWALYLLAKNPQVQAKLVEEIKTVLAGRSPQFSDLVQLRYTEMVVKETMRLYPSAWLIGREAVSACEVGGHPVAAHTSLLMSQWVKHRDPRHFKNPEKFDPERWSDAMVKGLPKFAYFPFGGGPRVCIGSSFAMMEAVLVLTTVIQEFQVTAEPGYEVSPWPSITLQPRGGVLLKVERRGSNISRHAAEKPQAVGS